MIRGGIYRIRPLRAAGHRAAGSPIRRGGPGERTAAASVVLIAPTIQERPSGIVPTRDRRCRSTDACARRAGRCDRHGPHWRAGRGRHPRGGLGHRRGPADGPRTALRRVRAGRHRGEVPGTLAAPLTWSCPATAGSSTSPVDPEGALGLTDPDHDVYRIELDTVSAALAGGGDTNLASDRTRESRVFLQSSDGCCCADVPAPKTAENRSRATLSSPEAYASSPTVPR